MERQGQVCQLTLSDTWSLDRLWGREGEAVLETGQRD